MTTMPAASRVIASGPKGRGWPGRPIRRTSAAWFSSEGYSRDSPGMRRAAAGAAARVMTFARLRDALQFVGELHGLAADVVGQSGIDDALDLPRLNSLLRGGLE